MQPNNQQIKKLRSLAHPLKPVVRIGQKGCSDAVLAEVEIALDHHELIKVKIAGDRDERDRIVTLITDKTSAHRVSLTGGVAILFRRNTEAPVINFKG